MRRVSVGAAVLWLLAVWSAIPSAQPDPHRTPPARNGATLFSPAENCVACHNGLTTTEGEDVSIGSSWRSTMMANSARDPYFHAGVRRETIDFPALSAEIQDECAACHMPMLQRAAHAEGRRADILGNLPGPGAKDSDEHRLAADGVSCTVCHQISADGLGSRETFNGRFVLPPTPAGGARTVFGPYLVDRGRTAIMRSATGFAQSESAHVQESALCATCHTLYTQARGPRGEIVGELPEQMNFQEWQHSAFVGERRGCQSCHMPVVPGATRMASVLGELREGVSRHQFIGGNFLVLRMLNRFRADLGVVALPSELEATARATIRQLETQTATLAITSARAGEDDVAFDVAVTNLTGHKFPTGYPSRRAWLHVTARDRAGRIIFESGGVMPSGAIVGNDNDAEPGKFEAHYEEITAPGEVQIYEAIMGGADAQVTTGLLTATQYLKDNRLLPRGFDKATAPRDIAVFGGARNDGDFEGGVDRVRYRIATVGAAGPWSVEVELRYQPIAYRWADNLRRYDAPETRRFVGYFTALAPSSSTVIARATLSVQ